MHGYTGNIEEEVAQNSFFRKVLYTGERIQLVIMSLLPQEEIGAEIHQLDQFIKIESGEGEAVLNGEVRPLADGSVIIVPKGTLHNIINTSADTPMKLYTVYSPPNHLDRVIHKTKAEADADEDHDHFDGRTTEAKELLPG